MLELTGKFATAVSAETTRTSATEDAKALPALAGKAGTFTDAVPARSMVTYRFEGPGR